MHQITLWFDGGAAPNPGRGYGSYWIKCAEPAFERRGERVAFGEFVTNNQAEYMSLISGLRNCLSVLNSLNVDPLVCRLYVYGDSKLIVRQIARKGWRCRVPHLIELRDKALGLLDEFRHWEAHWHSRDNSVAQFGH